MLSPPKLVPQGPPATSFVPASSGKHRRWEQTLDDDVLKLQRTEQALEVIDRDPRLSLSLPRKKALPGTVMKHVFEVTDSILEKHYPLIYKFGYCHCAHARFYNRKFGYFNDRFDKWEHLKVLFISAEPVAPGFVEAALIQRYKGL